jgi:hypothetical protein
VQVVDGFLGLRSDLVLDGDDPSDLAVGDDVKDGPALPVEVRGLWMRGETERFEQPGTTDRHIVSMDCSAGAAAGDRLEVRSRPRLDTASLCTLDDRASERMFRVGLDGRG